MNSFEHNSHAIVADSPRRTALVLGGGGSTGNAWLIGVVAGLVEVGVDVTDADLIVGTSAGSTAAAQLTSAPPAELLAAILVTGAATSRTAPPRSGGTPAPIRSTVNQMERTAAIVTSAEDAADMRRRLGAAALDLDAASDGSWNTQWRATVASRLPSQVWPQRRLFITAVDATTGEPVVFDRHSGVDLVDAVAASCSSGPAYRIGENRYIDGGYRSNADNADLASGYAQVLVLSPLSGRSRTPMAWGTHLATQVDELRAHGSSVETVFPDDESEHLFGVNAMDLSMRPAAARVGYDQGKRLAGQFTDFWH